MEENRENNISIRHKRKKALTILIIFFTPLIFMCILVNFLSFANPQWSRIIYVAQRNGLWILWDGEPPAVPDYYTGVWLTWHNNFAKESEGKYIKGARRWKTQILG
jgi:hypothetical protein